MKIVFPSKRVEAPRLSEEQISKLMDGRYVEGEFGLDEGDVFTIRYEGERFEAFCYRTVDPGRCRIRRKGRGGDGYEWDRRKSIVDKELQKRLISKNDWFLRKWIESEVHTTFCVLMI